MKASSAAAEQAEKASLPPPASASLAQLQSSIETPSAEELSAMNPDKLLTEEIDAAQNEGSIQRITLPIPSECQAKVELLFGKFENAETEQPMWAIGYEIKPAITSASIYEEPNTDPTDVSSPAYTTLAEAVQEACSSVQNYIIESNGGEAKGKAFVLHRAIGEWAKELDGEITESIFDDPETATATMIRLREEVAVESNGQQPKKRKVKTMTPTTPATPSAPDAEFQDEGSDIPMFDVSFATLQAMAQDIRATLVALEPFSKAVVKLEAMEDWICRQLSKVHSAKESDKAIEAAGEAESRGKATTEGRTPNPPASASPLPNREDEQATAAGASIDSPVVPSIGYTALEAVAGIPPVALKILLANGIDTIDAYRALPNAKHPNGALLKEGKYTFTESRIKKTEEAIAEYLAKGISTTPQAIAPAITGDTPANPEIHQVVEPESAGIPPTQKPLFQSEPVPEDVFVL